MQSRKMNVVLEKILETGEFAGPKEQLIKVRGQIPREEGEFLQKIITDLKPKVTLEVGLAYGISALFICDALDQSSGARHIVIDSHQLTDVWDEGAGLHNLKKAGYEKIVEFHDAESQRALPQLEASGLKIDFAFIDGAHTFDHVLVDFFYIDRMLRIGGVVAFDDADWPTVGKVCRFIIKNRNYSVYESLGQLKPRKLTPKRRILHSAVQIFARHPSAINRLFKPQILEPDSTLGIAGRCVALKKEDEDTRGYVLSKIGHQDF
jgi:predicted O-methyltransferase YrrM